MAQIQEAIYYQGEQTFINHTGTGEAAGDVVVLTTALPGIIGVANYAIASGDPGALDISGTYKLKKAADAHVVGDAVEWDISAGEVVPLADTLGDGRIGIVIEAAAAGDDFVIVKINMQAMPAT